jgi:hypothetical protein
VDPLKRIAVISPENTGEDSLIDLNVILDVVLDRRARCPASRD